MRNPPLILVAAPLLALVACAGTSTNGGAVTPTPPLPATHTTASAAATPASSSAAATTSGPGTPRPDFTLVNAADYREGQAYYFTSPSGNLYCGYHPEQAVLGVGCQAAVLVANMPECNDPDSLAPGVTIPLGDDEPVKAHCFNQGVYVGEERKVLPYGSALEVDGFRCESTTQHMACRHVASGRGFTIAREGIEVSN